MGRAGLLFPNTGNLGSKQKFLLFTIHLQSVVLFFCDVLVWIALNVLVVFHMGCVKGDGFGAGERSFLYRGATWSQLNPQPHCYDNPLLFHLFSASSLVSILCSFVEVYWEARWAATT